MPEWRPRGSSALQLQSDAASAKPNSTKFDAKLDYDLGVEGLLAGARERDDLADIAEAIRLE